MQHCHSNATATAPPRICFIFKYSCHSFFFHSSKFHPYGR
jgi:hypothetical protein